VSRDEGVRTRLLSKDIDVNGGETERGRKEQIKSGQKEGKTSLMKKSSKEKKSLEGVGGGGSEQKDGNRAKKLRQHILTAGSA